MKRLLIAAVLTVGLAHAGTVPGAPIVTGLEHAEVVYHTCYLSDDGMPDIMYDGERVITFERRCEDTSYRPSIFIDDILFPDGVCDDAVDCGVLHARKMCRLKHDSGVKSTDIVWYRPDPNNDATQVCLYVCATDDFDTYVAVCVPGHEIEDDPITTMHGRSTGHRGRGGDGP